MYMSRFAKVPFNALQISIKKLLDVLSHVKHKSTVEAGVIQHSDFCGNNSSMLLIDGC